MQEEDGATAEAKICESCVDDHINRGHSILDSNGEAQSVCVEHKQRCLVFCSTCGTLICYRCLDLHEDHELKTIEENEQYAIKTVAHTLIDQLENEHEKTLTFKKDEISLKIQEKQAKNANLMLFVEQEFERFKNNLENNLNEELEEMKATEKELNSSIDSITDLKAKLRTLLGTSFDEMQESFSDILSDLGDFETKYQIAISQEPPSTLTSSITIDHIKPDFDNLMKKVVSSSAGDTVVGQCFEIEQISGPQFHAGVNFGDDPLEIYGIEKGSGDDIQVLKTTSPNSVDATFFHRVLPESELTGVYAMPSSKRLLIFIDNGDLIEFNCRKGSFVTSKKPTFKNILWPYETKSAEHVSTHWSYWDDSTKTIRFSHDNEFKIECKSQPFIRMSCTECDFLCFVDEEKAIIMVQISKKRVELVPLSRHKIDEIDCVTVQSWSRLFVWTKSSKTISQLDRKAWNKLVLTQTFICEETSTVVVR